MRQLKQNLWLLVFASAVYVYGAENTAQVLSNAHLAMKFCPQTGGIVSIKEPATGHDFLAHTTGQPLLWRLFLHSQSGDEIEINNTQAGSPAFDSSKHSLSIRWKDIDLPEDEDALDILVKCNLKRDDDTALFRIWVSNKSKKYGLWNVQFPAISPVATNESAKIAIGRGTWGMLYDRSEEKITGEYPSHSLPMQFMLVQENSSSLYLAAHDPKAMPKQFELEPGGEFHVTTQAMDMGVAGSDWRAPYPFALGVYHGSWMSGCKKYRTWALDEAPWTHKGPLTKRKDVPEKMKNVCAWLLTGGTSSEVVPAVKQFAEAIGAPVGVHWYNWHQILFDHEYPNYFPTKPGFADGVSELVNEGIVVMPYINARLWDVANDNFKEARPYSTKDENGEVVIETYGKSPDLAPMCPTQEFWQDKVAEIIHRLGDECGVNAVYLDQIASARPRSCFDPSHSHPLGSGSWWVDGYREMLNPIKKWATTKGHSIGLTTENNAEPYMDNLDAHLIWTARSDQEIPINTAVYSGYTLYFASNRAFGHDDVSYCLCQARDFVWGTQLGWDGPGILQPEHKSELDFLSRLARLRAKALDYLVYGELLEVLAPLNDIPSLSGTWNKPGGDGPVTLKAVQAALWRGDDGTIGVLLANADTQAHAYSFHFDSEHHGLGETDAWIISRITSETATELPSQKGRRFTYTIEVPGRDALLLVFHPTHE